MDLEFGFGILVQFPFRKNVLNCSVTYIFCAMGIFEKTFHPKIDVFVKFESAINLEIRGQIKKKLDSFYLGHSDHMYAFSSKSGSEPFRELGDLTWNDPVVICFTIVLRIR